MIKFLNVFWFILLIMLLISFGLIKNYFFLSYNFFHSIIVDIAALLGIIAFFIWRRQPLFSKKLEIYEKIYLPVKELHGLIIRIYNPVFLLTKLEPLTFDNKTIKRRILALRVNELKTCLEPTNAILANQTLFFKYFPKLKSNIDKMINIRNEVIISTTIALDKEEGRAKDLSDEMLNEIQKYTLLEDKYIAEIEKGIQNPFEMITSKKYTNNIIKQIDDHFKIFENHFDSLNNYSFL